MTIPLDLAARIERLYTVEHWRVGTIARQLHVHRDTVRRVLRERGAAPTDVPLRPSLVDPYRTFILETLQKYPTLTARRLHDMVCERGYAGQASHFRFLVSSMRPRPPAEAYLRLRTLPGEQAQVDWGHFGHLQIGRARRPLMGFVIVLSYSRRVFLRFCLNAQMDSFLRGHVEAFIAFGGLARTLLYDNLKSVVLERVGDAIRFNPEFLAFARHFRFEPRPVAVARGNQKECGSYCLLWVTWNSRFAGWPCEVGQSWASRACACRRAGTGNGGGFRGPRAEVGPGLPNDGPWRHTRPAALPVLWR
jgi:transposase